MTKSRCFAYHSASVRGSGEAMAECSNPLNIGSIVAGLELALGFRLFQIVLQLTDLGWHLTRIFHMVQLAPAADLVACEERDLSQKVTTVTVAVRRVVSFFRFVQGAGQIAQLQLHVAEQNAQRG